MTILASELEKRKTIAAKGLKDISDVISDLSKNLTESDKSYKFADQNNQLIFKSREVNSKPVLESMVSFGGGVKARVLKTKEGESIIESFIFDKDRFDKQKASEWLDKNSKTFESSLKHIQESMPAGSFEDITCRVQCAINESPFFATADGRESMYCFLVCMFIDKCIVQCGDINYEIPFTDAAGVITLGEPKQVTPEFVAAECAKVKAFFLSKEKITESIAKIHITKFAEASADGKEKRQIIAVLIEEGKNYSKKRYYPAEALKEAAPIFAGLKNYIDHPTAQEEREKPERSIEDWVSTILESWYEDGKVLGRIHIHNDDLWNKIKNDPVFRENIGLSINASGKRTIKEIDGQPMEYIEKIMDAQSVDWVTEPGARGRVLNILESQNENGEKKMKTLKEVKAALPDVVAEMETEVTARLQESFNAQLEVKIKEAKKPLEDKITSLENEKITAKESAVIAGLVNDSKLPAAAKTRLIESFKVKVFNDDAKLQEAVKAAIESEIKYLGEAGGIKIGVGAGKTGSESAADPLLEACGIKTEEKK